ncbi:Dolichyl-phosphate beta-glucosyltransferase [Linum grandiflorum]
MNDDTVSVCCSYLQQRASKDKSFTYKVLIVDDGNTDATKRVAFDFVGKYSVDNVRVTLLGQNHGKGEAIRKGMLHSSGELLLMIDADGATKVTDLEKFAKKVAFLIHAVTNAEDTKDGKSGFRICDIPVAAFGSPAHLEEKALACHQFSLIILVSYLLCFYILVVTKLYLLMEMLLLFIGNGTIIF